jgi:uncharacterized protein (DUF4415 family)
LDNDVARFFEQFGPAFKRHINAVLRSYMQQKRKKRA